MRVLSLATRIAVVAALGLAGRTGSLLAQEPETRLLTAGQAIEREMAAGETHRYRLTAVTPAYVRIFLRPRGLELNLTISAPNGHPLAEAHRASEEVSDTTRALITDVPGDYDVVVSRASEATTPGTYAIGVAEWRPVAPRDVDRVAAERALEEGDRLDRLGDADAATRAIARFEEALALSTAAEDGPAQAEAYVRMSRVWRRLSNYPKAMEALERALPLRRAAADRGEEASVLSEIGATFAEMIDYPKARAYFQQALDLNVPSRPLEAGLLNNIGAIHRRTGDARGAREYYRRALDAVRAMGDRRVIATVTNNLALTSQLIGEYQEALDLYAQALALWRALGDSNMEAMTVGNVGLVYRALGENAEALDSFRQAYDLHRRTGNRFGEANTLQHIGTMSRHMGQLEESLTSLDQSIAIYRAIGDRGSEGIALREAGEVHLARGDIARALALFQEALELSRAVGTRSSEAHTLHSIASALYQQGDDAGARETYLAALPHLRESGERRREAAALLGLAQTERRLGDATVALARVEEAIAIIELLRSRVASTDLRASFQAANQEYYQFHIDLLMQLERERPGAGHAAKALQVSERARSRSLLDLLTEAQVDFRHGADPALVERERALIARINANDTRRRQVPRGDAGRARMAGLEKELGELLAEYRDVEAEIRARSPQYAGLTQPQPLALAEIQRVLDPDTLLLEYKLGPERSYLWAVGADSFASFELPAEARIDKEARRLYELLLASADRARPGETLAQKSRRLARTRAEYDRAATALGQVVLGPVAPRLGRKRLVIVSEGALQYVPFAALPKPGRNGTAGTAPLITEHEVVSLPSASVLSLLRREQKERRTAETSVAVLADPVFSADDVRVRGGKANGEPDGERAAAEDASLERSARETGVGGFRRLRFSRDEALAITAASPGKGTLSALDFRASRATATGADLRRHRIVHFATHGLLNSAHPELSGIVLSLVDEKGRPQDGFLRLHEIYGLELDADLVVLSACQTALGKEVKGEGLVGLTRGFMYAGAPRVVASLWNVEDRATADLMGHFYGAMSRQGMRPARALRAAQMALRADKRWAAPYYWAAFTLQGDWN